jgi:hypothetical protein
MIARSKPSTDCLSRLQISQWALEETPPEKVGRFAAHAAACGRCRMLYEAEKTSVGAAAVRPLPAYMQEARGRGHSSEACPPRHRRVWGRRWGGRVLTSAAALAACFLAVFLVREDAPNIRMKGQGALHVAVRRGGVVQERPLEAPLQLQTGDGVRLRVPSGAAMWVLVQKHTDRGWEQVFVGHSDKEGWLPLSFTISDAPSVDVRVAVCSTQPPVNAQTDDGLKDCAIYGTRF